MYCKKCNQENSAKIIKSRVRISKNSLTCTNYFKNENVEIGNNTFQSLLIERMKAFLEA